MKAAQTKEFKFEKVTLTIETKEEFLLMLSLLGSTTGTLREEVTGVCCETAYWELRSIATELGINTHKNLVVSVSKHDCNF